MIRLIINIIILLVLAVFIAMNVSYTTSINLFGYKFEQISTIAVILISIAAGVIYSFFYYILTYFAKSKKNRIKSQDKKTKEKAKELKNKEKKIKEQIEEGVKKALPSEQSTPDESNNLPSEKQKKQGSLLNKLTGKK